MAEDEIERQDVQALLETRHELGPTYDDALVSSFADRIEKVVERRVSGRTDGLDRADRLVAEAGKRQPVLGVVSLVSASRSRRSQQRSPTCPASASRGSA